MFYYPLPFLGGIINVFVAFLGMVFEYSIIIILSPLLLYLCYKKDKDAIRSISNCIDSAGNLFQTILHSVLFWLIVIALSPLLLFFLFFHWITKKVSKTKQS